MCSLAHLDTKCKGLPALTPGPPTMTGTCCYTQYYSVPQGLLAASTETGAHVRKAPQMQEISAMAAEPDAQSLDEKPCEDEPPRRRHSFLALAAGQGLVRLCSRWCLTPGVEL